MPRVALATCLCIPEPDVDEPLLTAALTAHGIDSKLIAWDDPSANWENFDACIIRSTWNYIHRIDDFLAWIDRTAAVTRLYNPPSVVRTNAHKSYLRALERAGIRAAPTAWIERGAPTTPTTLAEIMTANGWSRVVVKPTVSAGSFSTRSFEGTPDEAWFSTLTSTRDVMVQPYIASVDEYGERSLIWIDGELSHAIRKSPRFSDGTENVSDSVPIADDEAALARAAIAHAGPDFLYARVDLARGDDGKPMIMELELIEPSLFLKQHPPAATLFAAAIANRLSL